MSATIVFIIYPGVKLLDLAGPLQVFSDVLNEQGKPAYRPALASMSGGPQASDTPICICSESLPKWGRRKIDTLFVVGGDGVYATLQDKPFIECVTRLASRSRRVAAICSGAFVLAECGLLDGRQAVTHWESCHRLKSDYPNVQVADDSIYVNDGKFWTSAGVTAGIDMAIKMISEDFGRHTGLSIARSLVTYFVRPGGQSQFSEPLAQQLTDTKGRFDNLHAWIRNHLTHDLQNQKLADRVCMSARTFARVYLTETGNTPAKAVESMRVEAACRMLTESSMRISTVAIKSGFGDDERMRRAFSRTIKISPHDFRARFSSGI